MGYTNQVLDIDTTTKLESLQESLASINYIS